MRRIGRKIKHITLPHSENGYKPFILRMGGLVFVALILASALLVSNIQSIAIKTSDYLASVLPSVLVDLANEKRNEVSLSSLKVNPKLEEAAKLKAKDMAEKGYFAHYSPEGISPWYWMNQSGYGFVFAGENLAINFDDSSAVNTAWMNSPGHKANILNSKYTEIGIATYKGIYNGKETIFVVEMFGAPAQEIIHTASSLPIPTENSLIQLAEIETKTEDVAGESKSQLFMAVEDTSAKPLTLIPSEETRQEVTAPQYSNLSEKILSSPSLVLNIAYLLVALIMFVILVYVIRTEYVGKNSHAAVVVLMIIIIFGVMNYYSSARVHNVLLPEAQRISL